MKKLMALLVIALFLVSIVPVFAHENERADREDRNRGLSAFGQAASEIETDSELTVEARHEKLREKFDEAKANFLASKETFLSEKASLKAKIAEVKAVCRENPDSEDCNELKERVAKGEGKNYLLHSIDVIENVLEKRKAKIEGLLASGEISTQAEARLEARLSEINAQLEDLAELRTEVDSATTKAEIKAAARELRVSWRGIKVDLEASGAEVVSHRFSFAINRAESLERKLDRTLERLEAQGHDVSTVEADVNSFKAHIDVAQSLTEEARAKFADSSPSEADVRAAHELLVQAHAELKLAHIDLKKIISGLKASAGADGEEAVDDLSEEESEQEDSEDETESETDVDVEGSVELTGDAKATFDELVESLADVEGSVKLELEVRKDNGQIIVESEIVDGVLTDEQMALWANLQSQVRALVEASTNEDAELDIEIEHEFEAEAETEAETNAEANIEVNVGV